MNTHTERFIYLKLFYFYNHIFYLLEIAVWTNVSIRTDLRLFHHRSLFYQNVSTTPSKSDYYPLFFELAARVIFFNKTRCAAFAYEKWQNDFHVTFNISSGQRVRSLWKWLFLPRILNRYKISKHGKRYSQNRFATRLDDREALNQWYRAAESVCKLPLPIEGWHFCTMPAGESRSFDQLNTDQGRTRPFYHDPSGINPADA